MITIFKIFKHKPQTDEMSVLFTWSLMEFVNRNNYKELDGKSDSFKNGFMCAIEVLRKELIRISSAD